jgi:hypothetical protein
MRGLEKSLEFVEFCVSESGEVNLLLIPRRLARQVHDNLVHRKILLCQED